MSNNSNSYEKIRVIYLHSLPVWSTRNAVRTMSIQLWIAIKRGPMHLNRNATTHLSSWRLDRAWFLPAFLRQIVPRHTEQVLVIPCSSPMASMCQICHQEGQQHKFEGNHYLTFSVDNKVGMVYVRQNRHIQPPAVIAGNDESWCYYQIPIQASQAEKALVFLREQQNKPIGQFFRRFGCLCGTTGARYEDVDNDFRCVTSWYCSELTSAMLLLCCDTFPSVMDPGMISPCRLETILNEEMQLVPTTQLDVLPVVRLSDQ